VPAFEVVSAPVEIQVVRPLDLVLKLKGPVQAGAKLDDMVELTLANRSGKKVVLPEPGDERTMHLSFEVVTSAVDWNVGWFPPQFPGEGAPVLLPGQRVAVLSGDKVMTEEGRTLPAKTARIRAEMYWKAGELERSREVKSNWVEASVDWLP